MNPQSDTASSSIEDWETGALGTDEKFASPAQGVSDEDVDDALELQMISIRLQKSIVRELKIIATRDGIGYQPLIRQLLTRFVQNQVQSQTGQDQRRRA